MIIAQPIINLGITSKYCTVIRSTLTVCKSLRLPNTLPDFWLRHLVSIQNEATVSLMSTTPRQRVTHAHWILGSPKKRTCRNDAVCWNFWHKCRANHSSSSRLELFHQVHYFAKSPLPNGSTATEIDLEHCSKTWFHEVEFLKQAEGLRPLKDYQGLCQLMTRTVQTTFIYCFETRNEKACMSLIEIENFYLLKLSKDLA